MDSLALRRELRPCQHRRDPPVAPGTAQHRNLHIAVDASALRGEAVRGADTDSKLDVLSGATLTSSGYCWRSERRIAKTHADGQPRDLQRWRSAESVGEDL
eukprot:763236-Hanusia_phi.AAC.4